MVFYVLFMWTMDATLVEGIDLEIYSYFFVGSDQIRNPTLNANPRIFPNLPLRFHSFLNRPFSVISPIYLLFTSYSK